MVLVMERLPSLGKANKEVLSSVVELVFYNMVLVSYFN